MGKISFGEIEQDIKVHGWFHFGKREFECPSLGKREMEFYVRNNTLPSPCHRCYKALIFWEGRYSEENMTSFFNMIESFEVNYRGKLNESVVVFYFRDKAKMFEFLEFLGNKMHAWRHSHNY